VEDVAEAIIALKRAGWSGGDAAFVGASGERVWAITGHTMGRTSSSPCGRRRIRPGGGAVEEARELDMLGRGGGRNRRSPCPEFCWGREFLQLGDAAEEV